MNLDKVIGQNESNIVITEPNTSQLSTKKSLRKNQPLNSKQFRQNVDSPYKQSIESPYKQSIESSPLEQIAESP